MVKLGFLFAGSDCMMPHIVQGAINVFTMLIFGNSEVSYNCKSEYV